MNPLPSSPTPDPQPPLEPYVPGHDPEPPSPSPHRPGLPKPDQDPVLPDHGPTPPLPLD